MKNTFLLLLSLFFFSCNSDQATQPSKQQPFESIQSIKSIDTYPVNSSIRALEVIDDNTIWWAGSGGQFGYTIDDGHYWTSGNIKTDSIVPHFRAIAHTSDAIFLLSIESPALLYKSTDQSKSWNVVYQENHPKAFYDSMVFWDDKEGIAMGDPTDGCLSVIITRDGGNTWQKLPCDQLPATEEGEAAFAASNSNISVKGDHAWIVSGGKKARVFHSADRGKTWEVFDTPIIHGEQMTGIFTSHFYDEDNGIVFGGNWEDQSNPSKNKAITKDGGKTWQLVSEGKAPGYRSCVRYLPQGDGQQLMSVGIPGISFSADDGNNWDKLSDESYYTIRWGSKNTVAWVAGNRKVSKIIFDTKPTESIQTNVHPPMGTTLMDQEHFQSILDENNVVGSILVYDAVKDIYYGNDFDRAQTGSLPASTYKIPHAMIALETGTVKDKNTIMKWDGKKRSREALEKDMTFKEAFQLSCLDCFQEIAPKIGVEKMKEFLKKWDYGQMQVDSASIDLFWIKGNSKISSFQQVDFLNRFVDKKLRISDETHNNLKEFMSLGKVDGIEMNGKTGWSIVNDKNLGWFVGYTQKEGKTYYVATNIEPTPAFDMDKFYRTRIDVSAEALKLIIQ